MTCHPTDPEMAEFEGYEETAEREKTLECRGSLILMVREVMRFQAIVHKVETGDLEHNALREYRAAAPMGLRREALAELVARFVFGGTLARAIQCDSNQLNDPEIGYPPLGEWDPAVLKEAMPRE
jgi:hypothetical protein